MHQTNAVEIIELSAYAKTSRKLLTDAERATVYHYLATTPTAGAVIKGGGGIRKFRWGYGNIGKRGGVRIMYYYHARKKLILLLKIFAKNQQANISPAQTSELVKLVRQQTD